jgi:hypothetical protein
MTWIERLSQRRPQPFGNVDMKQTAAFRMIRKLNASVCDLLECSVSELAGAEGNEGVESPRETRTMSPMQVHTNFLLSQLFLVSSRETRLV